MKNTPVIDAFSSASFLVDPIKMKSESFGEVCDHATTCQSAAHLMINCQLLWILSHLAPFHTFSTFDQLLWTLSWEESRRKISWWIAATPTLCYLWVNNIVLILSISNKISQDRKWYKSSSVLMSHECENISVRKLLEMAATVWMIASICFHF